MQHYEDLRDIRLYKNCFIKYWLCEIKADKARGFLPNLLTPLMYVLMKVSHILVVNLLQSFAAVTAGLAACKG